MLLITDGLQLDVETLSPIDQGSSELIQNFEYTALRIRLCRFSIALFTSGLHDDTFWIIALS